MSLTNTEIYYFDISKTGRDFVGLGDISLTYNEQALLESVMNILATEPGERVMLPTFGCALEQYVFEPIDEVTASLIESSIDYALTTFEPRINNLKIIVKPLEDLQTFQIDVIFDMKITNKNIEQQQISIKLNKIR